MTSDLAIDLLRRTTFLAFEVSLPFLAVAFLVGFVASLLQAVTQVHEEALSYIPKVFAVGVAFVLTLPWTIAKVTVFAEEVFGLIAGGVE